MLLIRYLLTEWLLMHRDLITYPLGLPFCSLAMRPRRSLPGTKIAKPTAQVIKSLLVLMLLLVAGCRSDYGARARDFYCSAMEIVEQPRLPDEQQVTSTIKQLDGAIAAVQQELSAYSATEIADYHDQIAYLLPLSRLAKARLYSRFEQVPAQEGECWAAIAAAEKYLGKHIRQQSRPQLFQTYSVFFRREKIRRHAFTILQETYRRAGEKDLQKLMQVQIGISDIYLNSEVAHNEESYIREAENASWVQRSSLLGEGLRHGVSTFLIAVGSAASEAALQAQKAQLQDQYRAASDPRERASIARQMRRLDRDIQQQRQRSRETMQREQQYHHRQVRTIRYRHQVTVSQALNSNFTMLQLSAAAKKLPAYRQLYTKKLEFDNYVLRHGFDAQAAEKFTEVRSSLDELTRNLQNRRR